jgi:hypothetical protein
MASPLSPFLDKSRPLQVREVLGNSLLRHVEGFSQFAHCGRATSQAAEDCSSRRVGESGKSCAQTIHNRMVVDYERNVNAFFCNNLCKRPGRSQC